MALAEPAELNGYPGPMHVLDLAGQLELSREQRAALEAMTMSMRTEAVALGEQLIAGEQQLDQQFAMGVVTPASLDDATRAIGATQAALRAAHLRYHILTADLLTAAQRRGYAELRGYTDAGKKH